MADWEILCFFKGSCGACRSRKLANVALVFGGRRLHAPDAHPCKLGLGSRAMIGELFRSTLLSSTIGVVIMRLYRAIASATKPRTRFE